MEKQTNNPARPNNSPQQSQGPPHRWGCPGTRPPAGGRRGGSHRASGRWTLVGNVHKRATVSGLQNYGFSAHVRAPGPGPVNSALRVPVLWTHTPCSLLLVECNSSMQTQTQSTKLRGSNDGAWREPATAVRMFVHPETWLCSFEHVCRQIEHWKRDTGSKTTLEADDRLRHQTLIC